MDTRVTVRGGAVRTVARAVNPEGGARAAREAGPAHACVGGARAALEADR